MDEFFRRARQTKINFFPDIEKIESLRRASDRGYEEKKFLHERKKQMNIFNSKQGTERLTEYLTCFETLSKVCLIPLIIFVQPPYRARVCIGIRERERESMSAQKRPRFDLI